MATINIPGPSGQAIPIEVPDFAMEQTQERVLGVMTDIAAQLGADVSEQDQQSKTLGQILRAEKEANNKASKERDNLAKDFRKYGKTQLDNIQSAMFSKTEVTGMIQNTLSALGAPALMGTTFGLIMQQAQEVGDAFRVGGRVGLNFADNLLEVTGTLATAGLDLGSFSQIVGTNVAAVRQFADTTQQGSMRLMNMITGFRTAAEGFGNFGLTSGQAAELMAEELELRRLTMDVESFRNLKEQELVDAMVQNIAQQEAMAKITGQDVKQRIKAQMEARKDAVAQSFLRTASEDTRKKFNELAAAVENIPGGGELSKAILNSVATGGAVDAAAFAPQLIGELGSAGRNLIDFVVGNMNNSSMSAIDFASGMTEAISDIKTSQVDREEALRVRAAFGDETARTLLTLSSEIVDAGNDVAKRMITTLANVEDAQGDYASRARGIASQLEQTEMMFQNLILRMTDRMGFAATGQNVGASGMILELQDMLQAGLSSDVLTNIFETVGRGAGSMFMGPIAKMGRGELTGADSESAMLIGMLMRGFPGPMGTMGTALMVPQGIKALGDMVKELTKLSDAQMRELEETGTYQETELQKLAKKFGVTIENQERMAAEEEERRRTQNELRGNAETIVKLLPEDIKRLADEINRRNAEHNNTN